MRKNLRKVMALSLALAMVMGTMTVPAAAGTEAAGSRTTAAGTQAVTTQTTTAGADSPEVVSDSGIIATSSTGKLFADVLAPAVAEATDDSETAFISDISVTDATASVVFETKYDSDLVVAVFDETTGQMKGSGTQAVEAYTQSVDIPIEGDIPEYYIVKGYILDQETHEPLSAEFTCQKYTKEMQELMDSTIYDYDEDKVVNFDEKTDTNFAVVEPEVIRINETDVEASYDEADDMDVITENPEGSSSDYVIANADDQFKDLQIGDTVVYTAEDNSLVIFKVAEISVDGNIVSVTEDPDLCITDVFEEVKIESNGEDDTYSLNTDSMDEDLICNGFTNPVTTMALDTTFTVGKSISYTIKANENISGSIEFGVDVKMDIYISSTYQYVSCVFEYGVTPSITFQTKYSHDFPLAEIDIATPVPGIVVAYQPTIPFSVSAYIKFNISFKGSLGFAYDSDTGFENKSSWPKLSAGMKVGGKFSIGVKSEIGVAILKKDLAAVYLSSNLSLVFKAEQSASTSDDIQHECLECYDGDIDLVFENAAKAQITKLIEKEQKFLTIDMKLGDFYWSDTYGEGGLTTCPHISYPVTITTTQKKSSKTTTVKSATIYNYDGTNTATTDSKGTAKIYLKNGSYTLMAKKDNLVGTKTIHIQDKGAKPKIVMTENQDITADLDLYGDAAVQADNSVLLTACKTWRSGSAWYAKPIETKDGFTVNVDYWAGGGRGDSFNGADGIVLNFDDNTGLGSQGEDMGFTGNIGVELDSYPKNSCDPSQKHVAIIQSSVRNHLVSYNTDMVDDSAWHTLTVVYRDNTMKVYIDQISVLSRDNIKLGDEVYIGLSAATGDGKNEHVIRNLNISTDTQNISLMNSEETDGLSLMASYSGEVDTADETNTASFTGLTPGQSYVMVAAKNIGSPDLFAADNLLYIAQGVADAKGNLSFSYIPRTGADGSVRVYGADPAEEEDTDTIEEEDTDPAEAVPNKITFSKAINTTLWRKYSSKAQYISLGATCLSGDSLTYFTSDDEIEVSYDGTVRIPGGYVGHGYVVVNSPMRDGYTADSEIFSIDITPTRVTVSSVKNNSSRKVTVKWKKNSSAGGYQVQISTSKKFSSKKSKTVSKSKYSYTFSSVKKGKTWYARVRCYRKFAGDKVYSSWSKIKSVKVKK